MQNNAAFCTFVPKLVPLDWHQKPQNSPVPKLVPWKTNLAPNLQNSPYPKILVGKMRKNVGGNK